MLTLIDQDKNLEHPVSEKYIWLQREAQKKTKAILYFQGQVEASSKRPHIQLRLERLKKWNI